ncbi:hypothetical protein EVAR_46985_1 [Eumeta japonica]|uniref:Uncharacterized protein n=1 Tax=Eumeta variegata TaxID=151549 RepID=A0A4C1X6Y1_EUMVA|nr:hypothetical protein EVAR_46985_1 [Eumeta japonica]
MDMYKVDDTVKLCDSILNVMPQSGTPNPCLNLNYYKGPVALHTGLTDEGRRRTVIYADDLDVGLGPVLGNCAGHRVLNICMPGASYKQSLVLIVTAARLDLEAVLECGANIQGIKNKELEVELFMHSANIDILCITEHWLRNDQLLLGFPNHQVARLIAGDEKWITYGENVRKISWSKGKQDPQIIVKFGLPRNKIVLNERSDGRPGSRAARAGTVVPQDSSRPCTRLLSDG